MPTCALVLAALASCNRHQSALAPFGEEAASTRTLGWVLLAGALVIAVSMTLLIRHAIRTPGGRLTHEGGMRLVLWLGGVVPTVLLLGLLVASLPQMRPLPTRPADLRIRVTGEQFWWRVAYHPAPGVRIESANEVRVPVGRTVALHLAAGDVIHSFWIPGLAGKMDMIPGRTNTLVVRATRPGRFRGVCTEFCGLSHALMAFDVVAMEPAAFDTWLGRQRGIAANPVAGSLAERGGAVFHATGCNGCHAIVDTAAHGTIGPDLTHVGARATIAAGMLPNTRANLARFIKDAPSIKPGARMPSFPHLSHADVEALAAYMESLK